MPVPVSPWIYRPRPTAEAGLRLICFPFAGGGPSLFRNWPEGLPSGVEVCGIRLPGRENRWREPPFTRLGPLIEALVPALRPYLDRPFALFGHSLGALIAYELARALQREGGPFPAHLFVSAAQAPFHPLPREPLHHLDDAAFRTALAGLGGTPPEILHNRELMDLLVPMLRGDFAILETHVHQLGPALKCPLTAIGGNDDARVAPDRIDGWQSLIADTFQKKLLPGDHFFLISQEALLLRTLSDDLKPLLARVRPPLVWPTESAAAVLEPETVHVWSMALEQSPARFALLWQSLNPDEIERAGRLVFERDRRSFIAGRGLLRHVLGSYLRRGPAGLALGYSAKGKPFLRDHTLQFNLAHSHGVALLAVSAQRQVGVDVEFIRADVEAESLAANFFSTGELQALHSLPAGQFREGFFRCWTRKEAYLKAIGKGLTLSLKDFDVSVEVDRAALLATRHDPAESARWQLLPLDPVPGYAAALAVEGDVPAVVCRTLVF